MYFLKNYYQNVIQYDLINKFQYKNLQNLPKLEKIILSYSYKDFKTLSSSLLSLELISGKQGILILAKNSYILLKIRKGCPIGCKVVLKKTMMYDFFAKLLVDIFPQMKEFAFQSFFLQQQTFSYKLKNIIFFELEKNFNLFSTLSNLNISIVVKNTTTQEEFLFLLKSFKLSSNFNFANVTQHR